MSSTHTQDCTVREPGHLAVHQLPLELGGPDAWPHACAHTRTLTCAYMVSSAWTASPLVQWLQRALPSGAEGVLGWVGGKRDLQAHSSPSHMKPALAPAATGSLHACFLSSKSGNRRSRQKQEVPRLQHPGDEYQVSAPIPTAPCTLTLPRGSWTRLAAEPGPCPFACMSAQSRVSGTEKRAASWFPCSGFSPSGLQMRKHLAEDRVQESVGWGLLGVSPCTAWSSLENEAHLRAAT